MKAAKFRIDGMGVVVGRLKSPTELQYEDEGSLKMFHLTGNVVDTEYNDVFVLGKKVNEDLLEVSKMESLPKANEEMLGLKSENNDPVFCLAVPANKITAVEECQTEKGVGYHKVHVSVNKNTSAFLNIYGEYNENLINDCFVFILKSSLSSEKHEYGIGYAKREWTTMCGMGWQVKS